MTWILKAITNETSDINKSYIVKISHNIYNNTNAAILNNNLPFTLYEAQESKIDNNN